jgi:DNA-3-methyladenine glycosylase II
VRKAAHQATHPSTHPVVRKRAVASNAARAKMNGANGANGALPVEVVLDAPALRAVPETSSASPASIDAVQAAAPAPLVDLEPEVLRPVYWDKACADLVKRDRILKKLIPKFGPVHLLSRDDPFVTLARSVVGQQISVPAAQALWRRVETACPKLVPQQFIKLGHEKLVGCGLSKRKAEYILDLAQHFVSGALHVGKWVSMDDEDVIAELTQIRGIGRWTAEMFLIFNLARPNVLPLDDLGLIRAISVNYFSGEPVTRSEAREVAANWEPWRTVATWYMWRSLEPLQG